MRWGSIIAVLACLGAAPALAQDADEALFPQDVPAGTRAQPWTPPGAPPIVSGESTLFGDVAGSNEPVALTGETQAQALQCLSQAVYYEAANEPVAGRRAVAQVVLNRLRSPIYPKTVCGVVYQGSTRRTGCQFTFTCDGALRRVPRPGLWREAVSIAAQALEGHVAAEVGGSTHYHASYVRPVWASQLQLTARIGQHLFYRRPGALAPIGGSLLAAAGTPVRAEGAFMPWGLPVITAVRPAHTAG